MKPQSVANAAHSHVINYQHYLESKIQRADVRKNELTREKLKAGAVRLLEQSSYHEIRISTFCEEAGLAKGTFYLHFSDKEDLVVHVLEEYADLQVKLTPSVEECETAYEAFYVLNSWFAATFCENVGIHRSMMQLSETMPQITEVWTNFLKRLSARFISEIDRWSSQPLPPELATLATYTLWGMLDQALYAIYAVHRNPDYERVAKTREHLVETITLLQQRALFLENPSSPIDKSLSPLRDLRTRRERR